jgi:hypothetical protein
MQYGEWTDMEGNEIELDKNGVQVQVRRSLAV